MKSTFRLVGAGMLVLAFAGTGCSSDSSNAADTSSAGTQIAQKQSSQPSEKPRSPGAELGSSSVASVAYEETLRRVKEIEKSATSQSKVQQAVLDIEKTLKAFIDKYPASPEAADASFQLGILYTTVGQTDKAIAYLNEYTAKSPESANERRGYATFYLAEAYKANDQFDEAKRQYRTFIDEYKELNPRFTQAAAMALEDLDALKSLAIGAEPIQFEFVDLEGKEVSLANYKGKVVLIDFWATWCRPCIAEMPNVKRTYAKYNDKGFEIIGISLDREKGSLKNYIQQNDMPWPQYYDENGGGWGNDVAEKYKVRSIPSTFLLDRDGKIRHRMLRGNQLEEAVAKLIEES